MPQISSSVNIHTIKIIQKIADKEKRSFSAMASILLDTHPRVEAEIEKLNKKLNKDY